MIVDFLESNYITTTVTIKQTAQGLQNHNVEIQ